MWIQFHTLSGAVTGQPVSGRNTRETDHRVRTKRACLVQPNLPWRLIWDLPGFQKLSNGSSSYYSKLTPVSFHFLLSRVLHTLAAA